MSSWPAWAQWLGGIGFSCALFGGVFGIWYWYGLHWEKRKRPSR